MKKPTRSGTLGVLSGYLMAVLAMACAPSAAPVGTGSYDRAVPIGKSPFPRPGTFSYSYTDVRHKDDGSILVDFAVTNGTHRDYSMVVARVGLRAAGAKGISQRVAVGPIRKGDNRRAVARFSPIDFEIDDVEIEIVEATSW